MLVGKGVGWSEGGVVNQEVDNQQRTIGNRHIMVQRGRREPPSGIYKTRQDLQDKTGHSQGAEDIKILLSGETGTIDCNWGIEDGVR